MSITQEQLTFLIGILAVGGSLFGIMNYFRKPQEKNDITDAVFAQRFTEFDRELANIRDNHLHSIAVKLDLHIADNVKNNLDTAKTLERLETKLEERLSRKQ